VLVIKSQAGLDSRGQHTGPEATRSAPADPALEEKLDAVWAAHVQGCRG
jgi:hypothetical protein